MDDEREKILGMVEEGTISAEEANELLEAIAETEETAEQEAVETADISWPEMPERGQSWRKPFSMALLGTFTGASLLLATRSSNGIIRFVHRFLFWPLTIFAGITALIAFFSKDSPWLHVRVQSEDSADFRISLPFPAQAMNKALRVARSRAPNEDVQEKIDIAAEILAQMDTSNLQDPLVIDISDEGDNVQVYLY